LKKKLIHPFIVGLHYAFQDKANLYLVTEFMQGGELFFHLGKEHTFSEERAKFYICEIILALEYIHKNNYIYRDLKPENILMDKSGHIKLTDFGLSKCLSKAKSLKTSSFVGTAEYLAPEIQTHKDYTKAVDWWNLGTLFYLMITGRNPFKMNKQKKCISLLCCKPTRYII